jgi:hypothetical protein
MALGRNIGALATRAMALAAPQTATDKPRPAPRWLVVGANVRVDGAALDSGSDTDARERATMAQ